MFKNVSPRVDIQKVELSQIEFWRRNQVFERTTEGREGAPKYVFYEGPPTANGKPGSHHVIARAFKDLFPRYKVMQGYYCLRRGGWDTHGLPVEIAVEKELGITDKREIEQYGVQAFNEKCRSSVFRNVQDWERFTERMGYWVDLDNAYVTFTNDYIESVWWILKQLWDKELLYRGYKVVPYSPSSGTPLSSHEVSLGYREVSDPSVYVRFPVKGQKGLYLLAWTTTPWTLPGNVALAVRGDVTYVQVEGPAPSGEGTEELILAESLLKQVLVNPDAYRVVKRMPGTALAGMHYNPLYTFLPVEQDYAYVVTADYVSTEDGTGIVHTAPAHGVDDMETGLKYSLPTLNLVSERGRFIDAVTTFRGMWFKDADPHIVRDLEDRGLMYRSQQIVHSYPHNWRDDTPLMYLARETWFIRTTEYRDRMVALNQTINWVPEHVRDGRFGNWLEELKEWALGRERYWGTPLPVWVDDTTGEMVCIGSVDELAKLSGRDLTDLDLHRPFVDDIQFPNPKGGGGTMRRVPEVIDVWFDSGAMPVAQWGYPNANQAEFAESFPADYICEAVDQTRGWFYSLHAIASMVFDSVAYRNVVSLGHILDADGKKMSKSRGNAVDPWEVFDSHGADAFRWYCYTSGPPGEPKRFSTDMVGDVVKKFWLTLWNTYSFFVTYANLDGWTPEEPAPEVAQRDLLDRWLLAELHQLILTVTEGYESYDALKATRPIQTFVDTLSNWYVRLSRRRFWKSESDTDKQGAYATLYEALTTIAKLIAPAMPFLSDEMYRNLAAQGDADSVHLSSWPVADPTRIDRTLIEEMEVVQRLVSLGLAVRNAENIGVRQPLPAAAFGTREYGERDIVERYADLIQSELNVKSVAVMDEETAGGYKSAITYRINPMPRKLGKRLGPAFRLVLDHLRNSPPETLKAYAERIQADEPIQIEVEGQTIALAPDELELQISQSGKAGAAEERGYVAVLDTTLTPELIEEGLAREVVRRIQNLRRDGDLDILDRISVRYEASDRFQSAITSHEAYIRAETLADELLADSVMDGYLAETFEFKGDLKQEHLTLGVLRIS
jgi:isoleucyl-tRNA synthetase